MFYAYSRLTYICIYTVAVIFCIKFYVHIVRVYIFTNSQQQGIPISAFEYKVYGYDSIYTWWHVHILYSFTNDTFYNEITITTIPCSALSTLIKYWHFHWIATLEDDYFYFHSSTFRPFIRLYWQIYFIWIKPSWTTMNFWTYNKNFVWQRMKSILQEKFHSNDQHYITLNGRETSGAHVHAKKITWQH